ncbi:MAG: PAS domain S-box protein [Candidatus Marinimicrobia bacterium]|nr:PAS domain S-box protein [Candidatus Neomarinimicrobiota bacterium]
MKTELEQKIEKLEKENQALKNDLKYYSSLLQNQNDAVIIHDFNGEIIAWDKGAESILGWKQQELLSTEIFRLIPDNRQSQYKQFINQILEDRAPDYLETQKLHRDGSIRDIWLTYRLVGGETPYAIATTERDITESKKAAERIRQSEEKYQILVNSLADGIILMDENLNFLLTNPATEKILFTPKEDLAPKTFYDFLDQRNRIVFDKQLHDPEDKIKNFEIDVQRADGENRLLQMTMSSPLDHGNQKNILCILRDITDIKHMEDELIKADKLESLGLLAGGIAHDFNNILSIINGNVTLAKMSINNKEKLNERLDRIITANERAKQLTQQISTLSKGHSVSKSEISVIRLVNESVSLALKTKKIHHEIDMPEELPFIYADEGQLSQVLNNLLINASHAIDSSHGLVRIIVNSQKLEPQNKYALREGQYIQFKVVDNGCGIPEENLKKIFDPYFTTKSHGTGLGLSTSISIIKKHYGALLVESKVNVGTTFTIFIPTTQLTRTETEVRMAASSGKVLFMDDEETILSIAELFFQKLNYEAVLVSDGMTALDLYQSHYKEGKPFDFVFLDLNIPKGMSGFECSREILKINPDAKIIAVSGNVNLSEYKDHGFIKALKKPIRIANVQAVMKELSKN